MQVVTTKCSQFMLNYSKLQSCCLLFYTTKYYFYFYFESNVLKTG